MTLLIFLPAPAGTGIVAADFLIAAMDGLSCDRFLASVERKLGLWT